MTKYFKFEMRKVFKTWATMGILINPHTNVETKSLCIAENDCSTVILESEGNFLRFVIRTKNCVFRKVICVNTKSVTKLIAKYNEVLCRMSIDSYAVNTANMMLGGVTV